MGCALLALLATAAVPTAREEVGRVLTANGCAVCHDGSRPTAKPRALAVFDLRDEGWVAGMSESQLGAMLGRLRKAAPDDLELVRRFVEGEKRRRAQPG